MSEDKENFPQPQRKNSGKGVKPRRRASGPAATGAKDRDIEGKPRKLAGIRPRISIEELRNAYKRQASTPQEEIMPIFDPMAKAQESMHVTCGKTGLVYDERMANHQCLWDEKHSECPERLTHTLKRCRELGLIERCEFIKPREATEEEVLKLHSRSHLSLLWSTKNEKNVEKLETLSSHFDSIYLHPETYDLAVLAAGSTIDLVDAVMAGKVQNGMALIRPPGHHAMKTEFCGYCYLNNVALAAQIALEKHKLSRILIVDWDVHHGQATQQMFYDDPRVLYFSIHRYENGSFWPELRESDYDNVGTGQGRGFNFNVPLNKTQMQNEDYLAIFHQVLLPVAYEFSPELIIVSAGYDAAVGCPEFAPELVLVSSGYDAAIGDEKGEMEITPAFYAHLTSSLMTLANGRVAVIFEGGYCLESLAEGAALTLSTLLGDPCPKLVDPIAQPSLSLCESLLNLIYVQRPYWKCFQYQGSFSISEKVSDSVRERHIPTISYVGNAKKPLRFDTRNTAPLQSLEEKEKIKLKVSRLKQVNPIQQFGKNRLCLVYDEAMSNHHSLSEKEHPERPERTERIWKCLKQHGITERAVILQTRRATQEELELVHTHEHVNLMTGTSTMTEKELLDMQEKYKSIYLHPKSNDAALLAVGSLLQIVDDVCNNKSLSGIGVVRPPGHHAEQDHPHGFCLYNNVAVAAKYATDCLNYQRVLILDWDVHHGNGIQHAFAADPKVLYISIHRYDHGLFFPSSEDANYDVVGTGDGEGYTVNIPWNKSGMGDAEYMSAMLQVVLPIAYQFDPQLVLVSAGFDAARGDPLGGCRVTPECYGHMTRLLSSLAGGRVILALEGGYNLSSISYCMAMCAKALLGDPLPSLEPGLVPNKNAVQSISDTIGVHKKYWKALSFQVDLPVEDVLCQGFGGGAQPVESGISGSEVSSCNVSPVSTPSTASPPYVSAPSSPDKTWKDGSFMENVASPKLKDSSSLSVASEQMDVEVTPNTEISVRSRLRNRKSPAAPTEMGAVQKDIGPSPAETSRTNIRKGARQGGRTGKWKLDIPNVSTHLRAAASAVGLVKGATAVISNQNGCDLCIKEGPKDSGNNVIIKWCKELGLLDSCTRLEPRPALEEEVLSVHTKEYFDATAKRGSQCGKSPCPGDPALTAAGNLLVLIKEITQGSVQNGLALAQVHDHSDSDAPVNTSSYIDYLAIAARYALDKIGLQRVLLVDLNTQYCQNAQKVFQNDPRVLMFSVSMHNHTVNLKSPDKQKDPKDLGNIFSINLNAGSEKKTLTTGDCLSLLHQLILPVGYEFCPELVILSFGSELIHQPPPMSPLIYSSIAEMMMTLAQGRLAVTVEVATPENITKDIASAMLSTLQDKPKKHLPVTYENTSKVQETILTMIDAHQTVWSSLKHHAQATSSTSKHQTDPLKNLNPVMCESQNKSVKAFDTKLPKHTLCLLYDERMMEHFSYDDDTHPEKPERISCIFQRLQEFGIVTRCHRVGARLASAKELLSVHSEKHVKYISTLPSRSPRELMGMQNSFESIYFHRQTNNAALMAAGSLLAVVDSVLKGKSQRGIAVIRPPGHHAEKSEACGFCIFNNVAVAAKHAIVTHGLSRVLIVDWDIHHGNGIQHMFEADPQVLYISIHRYDNGSFFPKSADANYNRVGVKKGKGYNVNIPWNKGNMGDGDYMAAMVEIVLPIAYEFNPELVLVSSGFDAAVGDPLGGCKVSPECYGHMTKLLSTLAGGRVILALEGGYNLSTISYCMTMCAKALLGDPIVPLSQGLTPCPSALETFKNVLSVQQKFWSALVLKSKIISESPCNSDAKTHHKVSPADPDMLEGKSGVDEIANTLSLMNLDKTDEAATGFVQDGVVKIDGAVGGSCNKSNEDLNTFLISDVPGAEKMYAVIPLEWCPHIDSVNPLPEVGLDAFSPCEECSDMSENWVCLTCYKVLCGRFVNEHMLMHGVTEEHYMVLSYADLSVWCYSCDAYVHNEVLSQAKRAAHVSKFGEDIPGSSY